MTSPTRTSCTPAPRRKHRDVSSALAWQGKVYAADSKGLLSCYDLASGKEHYTTLIGNRSNRSLGSPLLLRGKLLWVLDDGAAVLVEPGPTFKVAGRNKLDGGSLDFAASPAVADGRLYLRSQAYLYCIGEKQ